MKKDSKRVVIIKERLAFQLLTRVIGRSLQNILHQFVQISCGKLTLSGSVEKKRRDKTGGTEYREPKQQTTCQLKNLAQLLSDDTI